MKHDIQKSQNCNHAPDLKGAYRRKEIEMIIKMILIGYIRVSTEEQARGGISLDTQRKKIINYAKSQGHELIDIVEDVASAKDVDRPGLKQVLKRIDKNEANGLIVFSIDRLSRSTIDFLDMADKLTKKDRDFISVKETVDSTTPYGRFAMTLFAALAELERRLISQRTKDCLSHCRNEGQVYGPIPFGRRRSSEKDKNLVEDPAEMEILRRIFAYRELDQPWPFNRIAHRLNEQDIPTKRGKRWNAANVLSVIKTATKLGIA